MSGLNSQANAGPVWPGLQRRNVVGGAVLAPLACAARGAEPMPTHPLSSAVPGEWPASAAARTDFAAPAPLVPMQARRDRIIDISVCTRPFRAQGPRLEAQRLAGKTVVHNYGHGGSGWSLSWGSAHLAVQMALATLAPRDSHIAVIGCGAIGLTSALVAQRAGLRVCVYCREQPPDVSSMAAAGVRSPGSRICSEAHATPDFRQRWEVLARHSFRRFQTLLGLAGRPVEWCDGYALWDAPGSQPSELGHERDNEPPYPDLAVQLRDLQPRPQRLAPHEHPFAVALAVRYTQLVFNLASYSRLLMHEFLLRGGEIVVRDFSSPRQFAALKERTLINATGYGARALLGDDTLIPVRGQTARLLPQSDVHYGITYRSHNLSVVARRDGLLVQAQADGDFGNPSTVSDRAGSEAAVDRLAALFKP